MATDCKTLTANARKIFERLTAHFPPDPWKNPQWTEEGKVYDNGWHDLRTSADRTKLTEKALHTLGGMVELSASIHRKKHRSLQGFGRAHFPKMMFRTLEILHLLRELDFQIETLDLVES